MARTSSGNGDTRCPCDRPSNEVRSFYGDALGLPEIASFLNHAGYSGVIFGLPGSENQLEFTGHADGSASLAPSRDNLLVLYFDDADAVDRLRERLAAQGYPTVRPENPYRERVCSSFTVEDPDGWRVSSSNHTGKLSG